MTCLQDLTVVIGIVCFGVVFDCLNLRAWSCSFVLLNTLTLIWSIYTAVLSQLLSTPGDSKYWLNPIKVFTFSHKGSMSHTFPFIWKLHLHVSFAKFNLDFWPDVQSWWNSEISEYNANENTLELTILPISHQNVSLKPNGMCFLRDVLAELIKTPHNSGYLLTICNFVSTLETRTPSIFWSKLSLYAQTTSLHCWSSLFAELLHWIFVQSSIKERTAVAWIKGHYSNFSFFVVSEI